MGLAELWRSTFLCAFTFIIFSQDGKGQALREDDLLVRLLSRYGIHLTNADLLRFSQAFWAQSIDFSVGVGGRLGAYGRCQSWGDDKGRGALDGRVLAAWAWRGKLQRDFGIECSDLTTRLITLAGQTTPPTNTKVSVH
ncbi:hypothetical protein [Candidatus Amarolinea dominans]|uniref:hypothetical protein n=1 Tax=Candidatus Amarolinea dominans TaxID=3140696 RepID=UPI0031369DA6|nr:hypothetical protein [Anaerolineae bacterium]